MLTMEQTGAGDHHSLLTGTSACVIAETGRRGPIVNHGLIFLVSLLLLSIMTESYGAICQSATEVEPFFGQMGDGFSVNAAGGC